ncbi:MAG: hypothetical protein MR430_05920 [Lachnospiraceae bacterium]|nr:hypothetical protein [Lachnospiraceae bacterium]
MANTVKRRVRCQKPQRGIPIPAESVQTQSVSEGAESILVEGIRKPALSDPNTIRWPRYRPD